MIPGIVAGALRAIVEEDPLFGDVLLLVDATDRANGSSIIDYSSFARVLTAVGNAAILNERLEFDGDDDWITAPDSDDWRFFSGVVNYDFTIEVFGVVFDNVAVDTNGNAQVLISQYDAFSPAINQRGWYISSGAVNLAGGVSTNGTSVVSAVSFGWVPVVGQPYDIALVRAGSSYLLFIDGKLVATGANAGTLFNSTSPLAIAGRNTRSGTVADSDDLDGRMRAVRITRAARYLDDYELPKLPLPKQPPTAQDQYWNSVVALLRFDGGDGATNFRDQKGNNWSAVGNAQLDTSEKRFGLSSLLLDGSGDYVSCVTTTIPNLAADDFTLELWARFDSVGAFRALMSKTGGPPDRGWGFYWNPAGMLQFYYVVNGSDAFTRLDSGSWTPTIGIWYHIAVVRSGADILFFVDGVQIGSAVSIGAAAIRNSTISLHIGESSSNYFAGRIDEVRVTKAARYTSNFTPPDAPFPEFVDETFNPNDAGPGLTFSDGNKTISRNVSGHDSPNYANASRSKRLRKAGKVYVEFTMSRDANQWTGGAGIMRASVPLTSTTPSSDLPPNCIYINPSGGSSVTTMRVFNQSTTAVNYTPEAPDDSISGMAIDFDEGKIWFRNQGNWLLGSLAGGAASALFDEDDPTFTFTPGEEWRLFGESHFSNTQITVNVGPTFAYAPPEGFGYW